MSQPLTRKNGVVEVERHALPSGSLPVNNDSMNVEMRI